MKIILVFVCILICAAYAKRCTGRRRSGWSCRSRCNYSTGQWVRGLCAEPFIPPTNLNCLTISNKTCKKKQAITTCVTKNEKPMCNVDKDDDNDTDYEDQWEVCSPDNYKECSNITPTCEYYCESPREGQKTKCSYEYSGGGELGREIPVQTGSCDDESGPCYAPCMCEQYGSIFCNVTNTCIPHDAPCGDRCDDEYTFCPLSQTCNSQSEPCGGKCAPPLRLCADQRCLEDQSPCNATCPPHLQYCMVSYSCLQYNQTCPCPPHTWGCRMYMNEDGSLTTEYQPGLSRQQQCDLAAGDTTPTEGCSVEIYDPRYVFYSTSHDAGDCHRKFVKDISGKCVPRE